MKLWDVLEGEALEVLARMPAESVHCAVTSPPYWQLRDYGVEGQLGLEATPEAFVRRLVAILREVRRVLRFDGTLWLNLGDTYIGGRNGGIGASALTSHRNHNATRAAQEALGGTKHRHAPGLKAKDLVGIPWLVAFALRADGWWLRADIVWDKPSPLPESVRDRPTKSHEYVFLLSKSETYYYDQDAVREPVSGGAHSRGRGVHPKARAADRVRPSAPKARANSSFAGAVNELVETRNLRSVWRVAQEPVKEAHFATFPRGLVRPCILAGCPSGGLVLDPFAGRCTTGMVALAEGRRFVGVELNPEYAQMGRRALVSVLEARGLATPADAEAAARPTQLGMVPTFTETPPTFPRDSRKLPELTTYAHRGGFELAWGGVR